MSDSDQKILQRDAKIIQANNYLAVNLYKLLAKEEQNIFFSPFSISTVLAMLFCGSRDKTAVEMKSVLGYEYAGIDDENVTSAFGNMVSSFENSSADYVLTMANSLLNQKEFKVKDNYKAILRNVFQAMHFEVDLQKEIEKVINLVNGWVKDKTSGKITSLLDNLSSSTVMVLLNAVYFKGKWLNKFHEKSTFPQHFYNHGIESQAEQVDMMHLRAKFPYVEKESFQSLQLPYRGDEIAMMILLPNSKDGIKDLESELTPTFLQNLKRKMHNTEVELALPKFKFECSKYLKEYLQKMGMNKIFKHGADFGGINESKELTVSEIVHKAFLEVNEEGSEAAAATLIDVEKVCDILYPEFVVDHPFIFIIHNVKKNLILLMGKVMEL